MSQETAHHSDARALLSVCSRHNHQAILPPCHSMQSLLASYILFGVLIRSKLQNQSNTGYMHSLATALAESHACSHIQPWSTFALTASSFKELHSELLTPSQRTASPHPASHCLPLTYQPLPSYHLQNGTSRRRWRGLRDAATTSAGLTA